MALKTPWGKSIIHGQKGRGGRDSEKIKMPSEAVSKAEHAVPAGSETNLARWKSKLAEQGGVGPG